MKRIFALFLLISQIALSQTLITTNKAGSFPLADKGQTAVICFDSGDYVLVDIVTKLLANDIKNVTGLLPGITGSLESAGEYAVIIGTLGKSVIIDQLVENNRIDTSLIAGRWEAHSIQVIDNPAKGINQALVIFGSDRRGTAYGVFELSEQIGVSPWYWWADVAVKKRNSIYLRKGVFKYGPPSVKYRGIFIKRLSR